MSEQLSWEDCSMMRKNKNKMYTRNTRCCKGLILFHILISSHFLLLASIFEFQCFGLFSGLTCPKFMGLEPLCYSYFCAFLGLLSVTWLSHVTLCHVAVICCKMSLICTCLHICPYLYLLVYKLSTWQLKQNNRHLHLELEPPPSLKRVACPKLAVSPNQLYL